MAGRLSTKYSGPRGKNRKNNTKAKKLTLAARNAARV
jgi:hypothetical protein